MVLSRSSASNSSIRCCPPTPLPSTQAAHQLQKQHVSNPHVLFFSIRRVLRVHSHSGNFCLQWFFIFVMSHVDIFTSNGSMSLPTGATSRPRIFFGLASAQLCHARFSTAESCSQDCWFLQIAPLVRLQLKMLFSRYTRMSSFLPYQSTVSQHEFSFLDQFCCESESCNHSHIPNRNLVVYCTRSLQHYTTLCVHQQVFRSEIEANRTHHNHEFAKVMHQECSRHWLFDSTFHLMLLLDCCSIEMCLLQPMCQDSFSLIQIVSNYSRHQDQNFPEKVSLPQPSCHPVELHPSLHPA